MNKELILKIRREAITKWASNHNITVHKFLDEPDNIESLEIFAKLIVEECLDIVDNETRGNWGDSIEIWRVIKERFGVE